MVINLTTQHIKVLHIGFDDTDSLKGSCTTHLAVLIIEKISKNITFKDYPRLIRNNPNIPWKTRGNAGICLSLEVKEELIDSIIETAIETLEKYYQKDPKTNPGFVAITGQIPEILKEFSIRALTEVISISEAKKIAKQYCYASYYIGNGRGLIGALAVVGNQLKPFEEDYTYELLTYRESESIGTKRKIDEESVKIMDAKLAPFVFNNIDEEKGKILISPTGLDPVLYGIRGEDPSVLLEAKKLIKSKEIIEKYCIFRTNQGTDQHFKYADHSIRNFNVFSGEIEVIDYPKTEAGGHVFFKAKVLLSSKTVNVTAFEPTKNFRRVIRQLIPGDRLKAYGGIRYFRKKGEKFNLQLEKCEVIFLAEHFHEESPLCQQCGKRMTSNGLNKGYKCRNCGLKNRIIKKSLVPIERKISEGMYIPPAQAQRHLVKPLRRYKIQEKEGFEIIQDFWGKKRPQ